MPDGVTAKAPYSAQYVIDYEHTLIWARLDALRESIVGGKGFPAIFDAAEALIKQTQEHFRHEEKILATVGYKRLAEHRAEHAHLAKELRNIQQGLESRQISAALQLMKMFGPWFKEHLEVEDSRYEEAIRTSAQLGILQL
jgi:hemerythrin-like metal-binding protein